MNKVIKSDLYQLFRTWLKPVAAFALALLPVITIISMITDLVCSAFEGRFRNIKANKINYWIGLPVTFYLLHLIGLLWTSNFSFGLLDIQIKLSLLFIPLVFYLNPPSEEESNRIQLFYLFGCMAAAVIMLISASLKFAHNPDKSYFFYVSLAGALSFHPTFISVYLNVALIIITIKIINAYKLQQKSTAFLFGIAYIIIAATIALLAAKMAEIVMCFSLIMCFISYLHDKHRPEIALRVTAVLIVIAFGFTFAAIEINNRFKPVSTAVTAIEQHHISAESNNGESTAARIQIWKNAWILFTENFVTGTGTGDIKDELMKVYARNNFQTGIDRNYSPHNQYLQTGSALGIAGLFILLAMLIIPAVKAWRNHQILPVVFLFILILNLLAESMLEVQAGVLFTGLFYGLFGTAPSARQ